MITLLVPFFKVTSPKFLFLYAIIANNQKVKFICSPSPSDADTAPKKHPGLITILITVFIREHVGQKFWSKIYTKEKMF